MVDKKCDCISIFQKDRVKFAKTKSICQVINAHAFLYHNQNLSRSSAIANFKSKFFS